MYSTIRTIRTISTKISSVYPCCSGHCKMVVTLGVPRETYTRKCPNCGQKWEIERNTLRDTPGVNIRRIDKLEWERTP